MTTKPDDIVVQALDARGRPIVEKDQASFGDEPIRGKPTEPPAVFIWVDEEGTVYFGVDGGKEVEVRIVYQRAIDDGDDEVPQLRGALLRAAKKSGVEQKYSDDDSGYFIDPADYNK